MPKKVHVIQQYVHRRDEITCVCGFIGTTIEYAEHLLKYRRDNHLKDNHKSAGKKIK